MVECQLPKLDVAGSTPVSRSIFSITYEDFPHPPNPPFSRKPLILMYFRLTLHRLWLELTLRLRSQGSLELSSY